MDTDLERLRRSAVRVNVVGLVVALCAAAGIVVAHSTGLLSASVAGGFLVALGLFCTARVMLLMRIRRAGR